MQSSFRHHSQNRLQAGVKRHFFLITLFNLTLAVAGQAQNLPANTDQLDMAVSSIGPSTFDFGYADAAGIAELKAHSQATGFPAWAGMTASGTIAFTGSTEADPVSFSMLPANRSRLEVTTPKGKHVTVVNGNSGYVKYAEAKSEWLSGMTATSGIIPFDLPYSALNSLADRVVIDKGEIDIGGIQLHRVTIESRLPAAEVIPGLPARSTVDCYFDPTTHFLVRTASLVILPGAGRHQFFRVTTYANYQTSGKVHVPSSISETLDGRPMWSMTLTSLDLLNVPKPESF